MRYTQRQQRAPAGGAGDFAAVARWLAAAGLLLGLLQPPSAGAISPALCGDDGVTEIPPFATSRNASQCLLIDPGNGDPLVPFQYEVFHKAGLSKGSESGSYPPPGGEWIDHNMDAWGRCRTRDAGQFCSLLIWDTTFDNYLSQAGQNEDILFYSGLGLQYLYFKDTRMLNGWKCSGTPWTGPTGITCDGDDSTAHSDGIQMRGTLANDGWLIFQDSALVNAHTSLLRLQSKITGYQVGGNLLFQGFQLGTVNTPTGAAVNWIDDCYGRGSDAPCANNRAEGSMELEEIWMIDTYGNVRTKLGRPSWTQKVVVVNTGCGTSGCGGEIEYFSGWPHPLGSSSSTGPGVCPNGYIGNDCQGDSDTACFCYTSLEAALSDSPTATSNVGDCPAAHCPHKAPPFVHLSQAGWENPPD